MTRLRFSSSTTVWRIVLIADPVMNMPNPASVIRNAESQIERERPKPIAPMPAMIAEAPIHLPSPRTLGRRARLTAATNAPSPTAPSKSPTSSGPW